MTKEMVELRASASVRSEPDLLMMMNCKTLEKERDELRVLLKKSGDQVDTVRREVVTLTVKASSIDPGRYMLKSDHSELLKKREAEFFAHMQVQLLKGHAEMRRQTVEAVEAIVQPQVLGLLTPRG